MEGSRVMNKDQLGLDILKVLGIIVDGVYDIELKFNVNEIPRITVKRNIYDVYDDTTFLNKYRSYNRNVKKVKEEYILGDRDIDDGHIN
jgi:hypothetical protein